MMTQKEAFEEIVNDDALDPADKAERCMRLAAKHGNKDKDRDALMQAAQIFTLIHIANTITEVGETLAGNAIVPR